MNFVKLVQHSILISLVQNEECFFLTFCLYSGINGLFLSFFEIMFFLIAVLKFLRSKKYFPIKMVYQSKILKRRGIKLSAIQMVIEKKDLDFFKEYTTESSSIIPLLQQIQDSVWAKFLVPNQNKPQDIYITHRFYFLTLEDPLE